MKVEPYLFFDGRCEEALEFYRRALGARVETLMRYRESPQPPPPGMVPPGWEGKVMYASFRIGDSMLMAADDCTRPDVTHQGFYLTLGVADAAEAAQRFAALADGGQVKTPLTKTFFAESFGMVIDRYGIGWMVVANPQPA